MKHLRQVAVPEVSVLMACHNAYRWLPEAIDSVLTQTYRNYEFIIVDDGSTDETWNIIKDYSSRDNRIVAILKQYTGLAESLNVGIARANGKWIARLDADDLCESTRLEKQFDFVINHPETVLLGSGCAEIDSQSGVIKNNFYPSGHRTLVRHLERLQRFFAHSSAMFRREIALRVGCYNPFFRKSQDWDLWLRLAERGRIACLHNCLVRVRKHSEQVSNSESGMSQFTYGAIGATCHFLRTHGCLDPSVSKDEMVWREFTAWVDRRMTENAAYQINKARTNARSEYYSGENGLAGVLRFSTCLMRSGHASLLAREILFGSSLPCRLAREWMLVAK